MSVVTILRRARLDDRFREEPMKKGVYFFALALCLSNVPSVFAAADIKPGEAKPEDEGWISLFNGKDFDGWYTYLGASGKNKDPKGVFKVENGMIHIED